MPSTLQKILPASNAELAQEIVLKGGLLVSEYLRECENPKFELAQRYIERDRLQALFSDAVCLIASYSQSDKQADKSKDTGSRHALNAAREWGIKRLAPRGLEGDERFNLNREILGIGGNFENVKGGEFSSGNAVEINSANIEFVLDEIAKRKSQGLKPQPNKTAELNLFD